MQIVGTCLNCLPEAESFLANGFAAVAFLTAAFVRSVLRRDSLDPVTCQVATRPNTAALVLKPRSCARVTGGARLTFLSS
jgi:hypothetical protein